MIRLPVRSESVAFDPASVHPEVVRTVQRLAQEDGLRLWASQPEVQSKTYAPVASSKKPMTVGRAFRMVLP